MTKRFALLAAAGALSLTLAACGGGHDEEPPAAETNIANLGEMSENFSENISTQAPPATQVDNVSAEAPPEATLTPDQQTQDDADATGMTARVSRDEAGNEAGQPAN